MLSAAPPPHSSLSTQPSPSREVRTLYRRICVLGATGKIGEANALRVQELEPALKALRESSAVADAQLEAIFATEEERVATAQTLAEILLPLLSEKFSASAASAATAYQPAPRAPAADYGPSPADAAATSSIDSVRDRAASPLLPGIADFIDEMLTQDREPTGGTHTRRSA